MELPNIKPIRNENIDYTNGSFFIAICTDNRNCILWHQSAGMGLCPIRPTDTATVVETELNNPKNRFSNIKTPSYYIMPNHIHLVIDNFQAVCYTDGKDGMRQYARQAKRQAGDTYRA